MKIAFVASMDVLPWGGSEELWSQAAVELKSMGHQVYASVPYWPKRPPRIQSLMDAGLQIWERRVQIYEPVWRALGRCKIGISSPFDYRMRQWLESVRPDIVCVSHGVVADGVRSMEICAELGFAYVSVAQANSEYPMTSDAEAERVRVAYAGARQAFFVSQRNLEMLRTQTADPISNDVVVRNPFAVSYDSCLPWPSTTEGLRLACAARLDPLVKGQDLLVEILAQPKWRARDLTVSLYGNGSYERTLRRLVTAHDLENKILFRGHVSNVEEIWRCHHGTVMPSRQEGLPIALVEAMLCARLGIVTDVAGNAELIRDNVTGFVAEGPSVKAVDAALERAWARRDEWQCIGVAAQKHVQCMVSRNPAGDFAMNLVSLL